MSPKRRRAGGYLNPDAIGRYLICKLKDKINLGHVETTYFHVSREMTENRVGRLA